MAYVWIALGWMALMAVIVVVATVAALAFAGRLRSRPDRTEIDGAGAGHRRPPGRDGWQSGE